MRTLSLFSVTSSTVLALTSGVVSPSCAVLWLCFFTSPSNAQGLRIPSTVTNQVGQSNSPSAGSGEKAIAAQPSGTVAPNPAPNSGNSASGSSDTKAGLSPEDVKTQIQQDIADKQKALQTEQDKLDGLKKERDSLNPDARGQEYIDKANELQKDALKGAIDQFKTGPIEGLKDAVESANRGKDMVKDWRDVKDAESKYLDEVDRQQNIGNEIARQENLVRQAETALANAKLSAAIVAPMVNAMSSVPVSTPSGCGESVTCNGWIFMPPINVIDKNGKIEKTYPGAWVCSSNCGAKPQSPPPQYNSAGTATNQNQSTITGTPSADQKSQQGHVGFTSGNNPTNANHPSGNQSLPPALLDTSSAKLKSESIVPQAKSSAKPNSSSGIPTTAGPPTSENLKLKSADTASEQKHPSSTATSADKSTALPASSSSSKPTNAVAAIPRVDTSRRASTSPVLPSRISTAAGAAASHAASSTASRAASNTASRVASRSASNAASAAAGRAASSAASNAASRAASNAAGRAASNAASRAAANAASRTSVPSDIRLKRDIVELGRLPNGLHLYRYRYLGDDVEYVGVMAQEVEKIDRAAVGRDANGYLSVDYGRLGLRLMTWEEWARRTSYAGFSSM